jgi:hypothetical protein
MPRAKPKPPAAANSKADKLLQAAGNKPAEALVISEVLKELMGVWGGPRRFAKAFHAEFKQAGKGGTVRARMLDSVLRLFQLHTANLKGNQGDLGSLTDDELRAAAEDLMGNGGRASDQPAGPTVPAAATPGAPAQG